MHRPTKSPPKASDNKRRNECLFKFCFMILKNHYRLFSFGFETRSNEGGRGRRLTGFFSSNFIASATARSSCGSRPFITSDGVFSTSMSGATPTFSTSYFPSKLKNARLGAVMPPPSIVGGTPSVPTKPPHVRVPISGPSLRSLK